MAENNIVEKKKSFPLWRLLYKNLILIIAIILICGAIGTVLGFTQAKNVYTAKSRLILKASFDYGNSNDYDITSSLNNNTLAKRTLPTLASSIKKSDDILKVARSKSDDNGISLGAIGVSYDEESLIFTVTYSDADKNLASSRLADVIQAIQEELPNWNAFPGVTKIEFVETVSHPDNSVNAVKEYPVSVSNARSTYIILSFVIGIVLAVGVVCLIYVLDNKIKDGEDLEEITGASLLSVISK